MATDADDSDSPCGADACLADAINRLERLIDDFSDLSSRFSDSEVKVEQIHGAISSIHQNTEHLQLFPTLLEEARELRKTTLNAAISKNQIPLSIVIIIVATMCLLFILRELGDRNFKATPTSLEIHQKTGEK